MPTPCTAPERATLRLHHPGCRPGHLPEAGARLRMRLAGVTSVRAIPASLPGPGRLACARGVTGPLAPPRGIEPLSAVLEAAALPLCYVDIVDQSDSGLINQLLRSRPSRWHVVVNRLSPSTAAAYGRRGCFSLLLRFLLYCGLAYEINLISLSRGCPTSFFGGFPASVCSLRAQAVFSDEGWRCPPDWDCGCRQPSSPATRHEVGRESPWQPEPRGELHRKLPLILPSRPLPAGVADDIDYTTIM
jgi:hypothetical protein